MKRLAKSILGVTLLEIMLVLAIAAMIIVMSVRYYQSATANNQANGAMEQIQALGAALDTLSQSTGSYSGTTVTASNIQGLMPSQSMNAPWGGTFSVSGETGTSYTVNISSTPSTVCPVLQAKLSSSNYDVTSTCSTTTTTNFQYTYTSAPTT